MGTTIAYTQIVNAVVSKAAWDEVYFSLLSLKAHIQSLPGWQRFDFWARDLENGDVKLVVVTNWDYPVQLSQWLERGHTADAILRSITPAPIELSVDVFEEIA